MEYGSVTFSRGAHPYQIDRQMPLYEYRCEQCGRIFEKLRRMRDAEAETECPYCASEDVERMLSTFATGGCAAGAGSRFT